MNINWWNWLKKLVDILKAMGFDNEKLYNFLFPKIKAWVIEIIELNDKEIEKKLETIINSVVDLILKTILDIKE